MSQQNNEGAAIIFLKLSFVFNSQFPTFDKTIDGILWWGWEIKQRKLVDQFFWFQINKEDKNICPSTFKSWLLVRTNFTHLIKQN